MTVLIIVGDGPYATEKAFNSLRLAAALRAAEPDLKLRIFLIADGVYCALPQHQRPEGSYNIEQMLAESIRSGAEVYACATCLDHRALWGHKLLEGVHHGTMKELSEWVLTSDRVISL